MNESPKADILSLERLYKFAQEDRKGEGLRGRSPAGREYKIIAKELTERIQDLPGFYLWGKYRASGLWNNIYLGKAGYGKHAKLYKRITEELGDERCFIWATVLTALQLNQIGKNSNPVMWHKQYYANFQRSMRKCGSTHIIWVPTPEVKKDEVGAVEADLIETLNPYANIKRPAPPDDLTQELQKHSNEIIGKMKRLIHDNRQDRFPIYIK